MSNVKLADYDTTTLRGRILFLLDEFWQGDRHKMATQCGVHDSTVRDVTGRGKTPAQGQIVALAIGIKRHPAISGVWVDTGQGHWRKNGQQQSNGAAPHPEVEMPENQAKAAEAVVRIDTPAPQPAPEEVAKTDPIETFFAVADRLRDCEHRLKALEASGIDCGPEVDRKVAEAIEPVLGRLDSLQALWRDDMDGTDRRLDKLSDWATERTELLAARLEAVESWGADRDQVSRVIGRLEAGLTQIAADLAAIDERLGRLEQAPRLPWVQVPDPKPPVASAELGYGPLRLTWDRPIRAESDLEDEDRITLAEWCKLPGPHRRVLRERGDRLAAGRLLNDAYKACGLPYGEAIRAGGRDGPSCLYPVADLRHYARWLSTAGLEPDSRGWLAYFREHALPAWGRRLGPEQPEEE